MAGTMETEFLRDVEGLFRGVVQSLKESTLTYVHKVADGMLMRGAWGRDVSNVPFCLTDEAGVLKNDQQTATLGLIWWWGNKTGAW